jgi:SAM-dependent methyltransferase
MDRWSGTGTTRPPGRARRLGRSLPSATCALVAAAIAGNAVRLRARVRCLAVLDAEAARFRPAPPAGMQQRDCDFAAVTAAGVVLDDATVAAAVRHAEAHELDVVDLVPGDLPVTRLIELATQVDTARYRTSGLAIGWGAGHAAVVRRSVLDRVARGEPSGSVARRDLDPVAYLRLARQLKRYAPTSTDLAVAPGLRSVDAHPSWRLPYLQALLGVAMPLLAPGPAVGAALAAAAPAVARRTGAAALGAYLAEPEIVAAGGPVRPRDLGGAGASPARRLTGLLSRPVRDVVDVVRPFVVRPAPEVRAVRATQRNELAARRQVYAAEAAQPERLFDPPRHSCPWCGSPEIERAREMPDLVQGKPGTFRLDRCCACTHTFQNPRLSLAGLDHYYRDFYDGLQAEHTELLFSFTADAYAGRARMVERVVDAAPHHWLDVGTGHGHFCLMARETWPDTRFDGLDMTDSIDEAERRGWVERGHRGLFPDLAADLAGTYDVVSMHHYLEHTREPGRELDAAHTVLDEGGHLLVELPAPESALGRWLGWAWGPWFQPQHQHLVPLANLLAALERRGFEIVATERAEAHQPVDLVFAVMLLAMHLAPAGSMPWDPPCSRRRQARRGAVFASLLPLAGAAMVGDQLLRPVVAARPELTNTYRVLARKT